jgi:hypothetical protein
MREKQLAANATSCFFVNYSSIMNVSVLCLCYQAGS